MQAFAFLKWGIVFPESGMMGINFSFVRLAVTVGGGGTRDSCDESWI